MNINVNDVNLYPSKYNPLNVTFPITVAERGRKIFLINGKTFEIIFVFITDNLMKKLSKDYKIYIFFLSEGRHRFLDNFTFKVLSFFKNYKFCNKPQKPRILINKKLK